MRTFLANLKSAVSRGKPTHIGGGSFSPVECQQVINTIEAMRTALELTLLNHPDDDIETFDWIIATRRALLKVRAD